MLKAQLRHKLATEHWINNEDLLTSAVFGTLANLPNEFASDLFENHARPLEGSVLPRVEGKLTWEFWPWWVDEDAPLDGCEPDVVAYDDHSVFVIEAKLGSGFGTHNDRRDQLDREWRHGIRKMHEYKRRELWLITVTAHAAWPVDEVRGQLAAIEATDCLNHVAWMSWTTISRFLRRAAAGTSSVGWASDVCELIDEIGLGPFAGFGEVGASARSIASRGLPAIWSNVGYGALTTRVRAIDHYRLVRLRSVWQHTWRQERGTGRTSR
jgi:hypothetical protein